MKEAVYVITTEEEDSVSYWSHISFQSGLEHKTSLLFRPCSTIRSEILCKKDYDIFHVFLLGCFIDVYT